MILFVSLSNIVGYNFVSDFSTLYVRFEGKTYAF